eukprot:346504-Amphidinium_carterae.1
MQNQCPKGKGKGQRWQGYFIFKAQCHKCWGYGHYAADCPSRALNSFEAEGAQAQGSEWWVTATVVARASSRDHRGM